MKTDELFERLKKLGVKRLYIDTADFCFIECELKGYDGLPHQYRTQGCGLRAALGRVIEVQTMALEQEEDDVPKLKAVKGKK